MIRTALFAFFGACLLASAAFATVGQPPLTGIENTLPDAIWLNGVAGGQNFSYQSGIAAAGSSQTTATPLAAGIYLQEVDTAASSTGVNLPSCLQGAALLLYNNGANTLTVYPAVANNPVTGSQDTINNATSFSGPATHTAATFFCAKNGIWAEH